MAFNHQHQHGRVEARGINKINWDALELDVKPIKKLNKINWDALELNNDKSPAKHLNKINWDALELEEKKPVKHLNHINWDNLQVDNKNKFIHNAPDLGLANKAVSVVTENVYVTQSKTFTGPAQYVTQTGQTTNNAAQAQSTSLNAAEASYASAKSAANHPVAASSSASPATTPSQAPTSYQTTPPQFTRTNNNGQIKGIPQTTSRTETGSIVGGTPLSASHTGNANLISEQNTGMSGGAKAGVAFAVIAAIALCGGLIFFCWRRRKQQVDRNGAEKLDEKHASTTSFFSGTAAAVGAPAGEIRQSQNSLRASHSAATAPRLSLRPVTQFLPNIMGGGNSNTESTRDGPQMSEKSKSGWDRTPAGTTTNPFDDAAVLDEKNARPVSPLNPFEEGDGAKKSPSHSQKNSWEGSEPPTPKSTKFGTAAAVPISAAGAASGPKGPAGPNNVHRVQLDFKPSMDDELELRSGQLVRMVHEYDDGWVSLAFIKLCSVYILTSYSVSACVWIAPNKVSARVLAYLSSLSSHVLKAHHQMDHRVAHADHHRPACHALSPQP